jgi:hypothetical protein
VSHLQRGILSQLHCKEQKHEERGTEEILLNLRQAVLGGSDEQGIPQRVHSISKGPLNLDKGTGDDGLVIGH